MCVDILLLTLIFGSTEAPASSNNLTMSAKEYPHTQYNMCVCVDVLLLTLIFASTEAPASSNNLTMSALPYWA